MTTKGEAKRQRIIGAANDLFYRKGYAQTSFADIAERADMPKGNFYFYFRTKDALLEAVVQDRLDRLTNMMAEWRDTLTDPHARLHRIADIPLQDMSEVIKYGCPMGSLSAELGKPGAAQTNFVTVMFDHMLEEIEQCLTELGFPPDEVRRRAHQMLVRMQGAATMAHAYGDAAWLKDEAQAIHTWIDNL